MTFTETINDAPMTTGVPSDAAGLRAAFIAQREYTLALYADLPSAYWEPRNFPQQATVNPALWELAHLAWFQEFFALRWRADDVAGVGTPSCLAVADQLFDSRNVPHQSRWQLAYPSKAICLDYMQRVQQNVLEALAGSGADARYSDRYGFQLALVHEDMHAEALAMTLTSIGLPLPTIVPGREVIKAHELAVPEFFFAGGRMQLGSGARSFSFDNEKSAHIVQLEPFAIDAHVVTAREFAAFAESGAWRDPRHWSNAGRVWRDGEIRLNASGDSDLAAMHVSFFAAEAYCHWKNRRLPTEAEWEHAATSSDAFFASTGHVWEWTASPFAPYPGFKAERYREYSEPWFHSHQVLKGGSFVTHPRLKYRQYRNFYTSDRTDMFCGFRTCAN